MNAHPPPRRIVVLVSGAGSNLEALLDRDDLGGVVVLVVSDVPDAGGLTRARAAGVGAAVVDRQAYHDRGEWQDALTRVVAAAEPDLVVLAGFMRILSGEFVRRWPTVNVHPSLLPAFPGAHAVTEALTHGVKVTGATVHFVVEEVDAGPIIAQEAVGVTDSDDAGTLHERIKAAEHRLLPEAVKLFCHERLVCDGRRVTVPPGKVAS